MKYCVGVVLKNDKCPQRFLAVRRPDEDADLGGHWGLPAIALDSGELPHNAAVRVCVEKLGCNGLATRFIGAMFQERNSYDICFLDVEMTLIGSRQPDCLAATSAHTNYVEQKWTDDPLDIMPSAQQGSCCSSIFLSDRGLLDRQKWIHSLVGSDIVG